MRSPFPRLFIPLATGALTLLITLRGSAAEPQHFIVSDVDDTVKVTHVVKRSDMLRRGLFSRKAFAGMSTLYRELNQSFGGSPVHFVSGSPRKLWGILSAFFDCNDFPAPWTLTLKGLFEDTADFKLGNISALLETAPEGSKAILVGDDGQSDPEIYAELRERYPEKIQRIYIHRIWGREVPEGVIHYDTASDIALYELANGSLLPEQVTTIAQAVIDSGQKDEETLFLPEYCPGMSSPRVTDELAPRLGADAVEAVGIARSAEDLIRSSCEAMIARRIQYAKDQAEEEALSYPLRGN